MIRAFVSFKRIIGTSILQALKFSMRLCFQSRKYYLQFVNLSLIIEMLRFSTIASGEIHESLASRDLRPGSSRFLLPIIQKQ